MVLLVPTTSLFYEDSVPLLRKRPFYHPSHLDWPFSNSYNSPSALCLPPKRRYIHHPTTDLLNLFRDDHINSFNNINTEDGSLALDVRGFEPESIKVSLDKKRQLATVSAKTEKKDDEGNVVFCKTMERSFTLPADADLAAVKSKVSKEGLLRLEVPKLDQEALKNMKEKKEKDNKDEEEGDQILCLEVEVEKDEGRNDTATETSLKIHVNAPGYTPDDLSIDAAPATGVVKVSGRREDKEAGEVHQFVKTFRMNPREYDLESIACRLDKEGVLVLEAQRKKEEEKEKRVVHVPVKMIE